MNLDNLETLRRSNLKKFRTNWDAIIEKFSRPFDEKCHDVIDLKTLTISSDKGQLRNKSYVPKTFGKIKLAVEECHDLTNYIEDSALGTSQLSTTLYELNTTESKLHDTLIQPPGLSVNHCTSFPNDDLCEVGNEEPEPSDAETLSESDSDSWESDDEVPDEGGSSSVSKETTTSDDAVSTSGDILDKSLNLPFGLEDVPSVGLTDLRVEELSRSPELYRSSSAVVQRHENEESLKECARSECVPQFKLITESNRSPEKEQSALELPKTGFVFQNFVHLMQNHSKSKYSEAQSEALHSRSISVNDKISGQDTEAQMLSNSIGVRDHEIEPSLEDSSEETQQNQDVQFDVSCDASDNSYTSCSGPNKALNIEGLSNLNHVGAICNMQNHASTVMYSGLSTANSRRLFNSTFTVTSSVNADNNGLAQKEQHILKTDFSIDDSLIRRRCRRSDLVNSGCPTMNLLNSGKSSSSVSISETVPEVSHKTCTNSSGSKQKVMSTTTVPSQRDGISLTTFSSQPTDQSLVKLPNRFLRISGSDKPAVTLSDFVPCCSTASPVNSLPGFVTTCNKESCCLADRLPSMKRLQDMYDQMKSVVPKVIAERVLPVIMSESPNCAANRTETDFNDVVSCRETSSMDESIDQNDCTVAGTYGNEVQMVEKPFAVIDNLNLPTSGLMDSSTEQSFSNCSSHPDRYKMANRNCIAESQAYTQLRSRTVETRALPKTPTQQIGNAFHNSLRQQACIDSSTSSFSPSECLSKLKLSSPEVLLTRVENLQHSRRKSKRDIFKQADKVAEINNNSSSIQPGSVSCDQRHEPLAPSVEEMHKRGNCVTAMKKMDQKTDSTSCAHQIAGLKNCQFNKSEINLGVGGSDVSMQSLNRAEPGNRSDFASDTDEDESYCISLLSDLEEDKDVSGETNVINDMKEKVVHDDTESEKVVRDDTESEKVVHDDTESEKVVHDDTESEDAHAFNLVGATSTPTKDGSGFLFDTSFLSCISDSSEIERIKELAMEIICDDLEETLIEKTKIKSSVTAEPTLKPYMSSSVTCAETTEGDEKSLEPFRFHCPSDDLQGIKSLAAFRQVVQGNKAMAKTGPETASKEMLKLDVNGTLSNVAMGKSKEDMLKTDKILASDEGKMDNHTTEKLIKPTSIPITKILEINDNDTIKTNRKVLQTNLEMRKTSDNAKTFGQIEDKTKEVCVRLRHPDSLSVPVSSNHTIQVRKRATRVCTLDQTVTPASASVNSEAHRKLTGRSSSGSVVKATCSNDGCAALFGTVMCLPVVPVSVQPTKIESKVFFQPLAPASISAPAKLFHSFYSKKTHHKSETDKTTFSHHQKATDSQSDVISAVSKSSHKSQFDGSVQKPRKTEVELVVSSHKTLKRSSDNCHLEHDRSTKRFRSSQQESLNNDKKIAIHETYSDDKQSQARDERPRISSHVLPTLRTRKHKKAFCLSSAAK